jgi:hypothetical protein
MALPTASDNAFPSILITEGTEPSAPAAGKQRLYIDSTTHLLKATNSSGTDRTLESSAITVEEVDGSPTDAAVTKIVFPNGTLGITSHVATYTPAGGSGAGTILATNVYAPGTASQMKQSSGTMGDADATNMKVTATTAATCIVRLSGTLLGGSGATAGDRGYWGIRIGSSTPTGGGPQFMFMAQGTLPSNLLQGVSVDFYLSGLTPGSNIFKWGIAGGGSAQMGVYADASNPAIMTVIST